MCWAVPAVITRVEGNTAYIDLGDEVLRPVIVGIEPERVKPGSIAMVHAGVIISILDLEAIEEMKENFISLYTALAVSDEERERARREAEAMFQELLERSKRYAETREHGQIAIW